MYVFLMEHPVRNADIKHVFCSLATHVKSVFPNPCFSTGYKFLVIFYRLFRMLNDQFPHITNSWKVDISVRCDDKLGAVVVNSNCWTGDGEEDESHGNKDADEDAPFNVQDETGN